MHVRSVCLQLARNLGSRTIPPMLIPFAHRRFILTPAVISIAVLVAGCGGGGKSGATIASLSSTTTQGSTTQTTAGSLMAAGHRGGTSLSDTASEGVAYANCLHAHGLPNYPDPHFVAMTGPESHLMYVPPPNTASGLGANASQVLTAAKACARQRGAMFGQPTAAQVAAEQKAALAFAACMRSHGIGDYPEPVFNSQGIETDVVPARAVSLSGYSKAEQVCITDAPSS
jgi:hypothetical protein